MGYRAELLDGDTAVREGGTLTFEDARSEAIAYLRARLERIGTDTPARLARLRLALLKLTAADYSGG